ncbi:MAG: hypothetical protein SGILL_002521 [Bacillariaceae sp.]
MKFALLTTTLLANTVASISSREKNHADSTTPATAYSFEEFVRQHAKIYATEEEYGRRRDIFYGNLATIQDHNQQGEHNYTLGVNYFADMLQTELPMGLDKSLHPAYGENTDTSGSFMAASTKRHLRSGAKFRTPSIDFDLDIDLQDLPGSVDWRSRESMTSAVKNQGHCGSCWAFAATAALESHIAIQTGKLFDLSVQELVSCAPNQKACGGHGGCSGSTAEIAYQFVAEHGMVEEWKFAYQSFNGAKINCTVMKDETNRKEVVEGAVASVVGFSNLPTNSYKAMMTAVVFMGPIVVNVAASGWGLYDGGIYDDDKAKDRDINHAVVLEGYGTDKNTGQDYWIIRNSWSPTWGENGRIRLKRVDPSTLDDPDSDCKMDNTPADGIACTKDDSGSDIIPPKVKVCGTSAVLFDGVVPLGGHLL